MVPSLPASLLSSSGHTELRLWLGDRAVCLALFRAGSNAVAHGSLSGLPVESIATKPPRSAAEPVKTGQGERELRLAMAAGAYLHISAYRDDSFVLTAQGYKADDCAEGEQPHPVEAEFSLEELGGCVGLGHLMRQPWPLEDGALELGPFYPFDNGPNGLCTLAVPTCVSRTGVSLSCRDSETSCLHVSLNAASTNIKTGKPYKWGVGVANFDRMILPRPSSEADGDGKLRFQARSRFDWPHVKHPWLVGQADGDSTLAKTPKLTLEIGAADTARSAIESGVLGKLIDTHPEGRPLPPTSMLQNPIWTTWARYKDAVTHADVLQYARDIVDRGLPHSVMEIDDRWSVKYGDLDFDPVKFPDPAHMVAELHKLGFQVTLWIIPFANTDSVAVSRKATRRHFVRGQDGEVGEFDWWQPTRVAALDVTSPAACGWFLECLQSLQQKYGIDGFKFDAGEPSFLPRHAITANPLRTPSDYTRHWINNVAGKFGLSEVRSGVGGTEAAAPLLRLFDRFSTWGVENGLASIVSSMLTASMLGWPFVLPDMIGGNAYGDEVPDDELMIRWAQATAAMPAMQFSIPPWDYGPKCERLCADALGWRSSLFWPAIESCLRDASTKFAPIARPVWWNERCTVDAFRATDQFLLGENLMIAPVVEKGKTERSVYIPTGSWQRLALNSEDSAATQGEVVTGPQWLTAVPAKLDDMPVFRRIPVDAQAPDDSEQ